MTRLSKAQLKEKAALSAVLTSTFDALVAELNNTNKTAASVATALGVANMARVDAHEFCSGIADDIDAYIDERSESWQEGDKGCAFIEWKDSWSEASDEFDNPIESVDESISADALTVDEKSLADTLDELPNEPE
jgi:hypothetical protein